MLSQISILKKKKALVTSYFKINCDDLAMQVHKKLVPKVHKSRTETSKWRTILAGWEVPCGRVINILTMGDFRRSKTLC